MRSESSLDHVYMYLRHLSTEHQSILSVDMSTKSWLIYRPVLGQYVGRVPTKCRLTCMFLELVDCRSTLSVSISVDTQPTPRPICCDQQSLVYWSTVSGVGVLSTFLAEISAVSYPQATRKKSPSPMLVC